MADGPGRRSSTRIRDAAARAALRRPTNVETDSGPTTKRLTSAKTGRRPRRAKSARKVVGRAGGGRAAASHGEWAAPVQVWRRRPTGAKEREKGRYGVGVDAVAGRSGRVGGYGGGGGDSFGGGGDGSGAHVREARDGAGHSGMQVLSNGAVVRWRVGGGADSSGVDSGLPPAKRGRCASGSGSAGGTRTDTSGSRMPVGGALSGCGDDGAIGGASRQADALDVLRRCVQELRSVLEVAACDAAMWETAVPPEVSRCVLQELLSLGRQAGIALAPSSASNSDAADGVAVVANPAGLLMKNEDIRRFFLLRTATLTVLLCLVHHMDLKATGQHRCSDLAPHDSIARASHATRLIELARSACPPSLGNAYAWVLVTLIADRPPLLVAAAVNLVWDRLAAIGVEDLRVDWASPDLSACFDVITQLYKECLGQMPPRMRKAYGTYYTPFDIVRFMLLRALDLDDKHRSALWGDNVGQRHEALRQINKCLFRTTSTGALGEPTTATQSCFDPCMGTGTFVVGFVSLCASVLLMQNTDRGDPLQYRKRLMAIVNGVVGVDKDPFSVALSRINVAAQLVPLLLRRRKPLPSAGVGAAELLDSFALHEADSLILRPPSATTTVYWKARSCVWAHVAHGGFDIVLANPPYLDKANVTSELYIPPGASLHDIGKNNLSNVFMGLSIAFARKESAVRPGGRVAVVAGGDATYFQGKSARVLACIGRNARFCEVFDFPKRAVFPEAETCITITVLQRQQDSDTATMTTVTAAERVFDYECNNPAEHKEMLERVLRQYFSLRSTTDIPLRVKRMSNSTFLRLVEQGAARSAFDSGIPSCIDSYFTASHDMALPGCLEPVSKYFSASAGIVLEGGQQLFVLPTAECVRKLAQDPERVWSFVFPMEASRPAQLHQFILGADDWHPSRRSAAAIAGLPVCATSKCTRATVLLAVPKSAAKELSIYHPAANLHQSGLRHALELPRDRKNTILWPNLTLQDNMKLATYGVAHLSDSAVDAVRTLHASAEKVVWQDTVGAPSIHAPRTARFAIDTEGLTFSQRKVVAYPIGSMSPSYLVGLLNSILYEVSISRFNNAGGGRYPLPSIKFKHAGRLGPSGSVWVRLSTSSSCVVYLECLVQHMMQTMRVAFDECCRLEERRGRVGKYRHRAKIKSLQTQVAFGSLISSLPQPSDESYTVCCLLLRADLLRFAINDFVYTLFGVAAHHQLEFEEYLATRVKGGATYPTISPLLLSLLGKPLSEVVRMAMAHATERCGCDLPEPVFGGNTIVIDRSTPDEGRGTIPRWANFLAISHETANRLKIHRKPILP